MVLRNGINLSAIALYRNPWQCPPYFLTDKMWVVTRSIARGCRCEGKEGELGNVFISGVRGASSSFL